jgi:hypothetical protein
MFVGLFPRKRDELPAGNLRKLVESFDTIEDPVLAMKLTSVKRGVKGTLLSPNRMARKWTGRKWALLMLNLLRR